MRLNLGMNCPPMVCTGITRLGDGGNEGKVLA
jgi:hypothetical protein